MAKKELLEKDIVDYVIANWQQCFPDFNFQRRETTNLISNWKPDIMANMDIDLEEIGYRDKPETYRAAIFIEVKFNSNMRDLIYELEKGLYLRNCLWNNGQNPYPVYLGVLSDSFDDIYIYNYLVENNIHMWKIDIKDNDLSSIKVRYYTPDETNIEDIAL